MMEDKLLDIAASGSSAARADRIGMAKLAKLAFDGRDLRHRINKINVLRELQRTNKGTMRVSRWPSSARENPFPKQNGSHAGRLCVPRGALS
jgi:hypothetical protein